MDISIEIEPGYFQFIVDGAEYKAGSMLLDDLSGGNPVMLKTEPYECCNISIQDSALNPDNIVIIIEMDEKPWLPARLEAELSPHDLHQRLREMRRKEAITLDLTKEGTWVRQLKIGIAPTFPPPSPPG